MGRNEVGGSEVQGGCSEPVIIHARQDPNCIPFPSAAPTRSDRRTKHLWGNEANRASLDIPWPKRYCFQGSFPFSRKVVAISFESGAWAAREKKAEKPMVICPPPDCLSPNGCAVVDPLPRNAERNMTMRTAGPRDGFGREIVISAAEMRWQGSTELFLCAVSVEVPGRSQLPGLQQNRSLPDKRTVATTISLRLPVPQQPNGRPFHIEPWHGVELYPQMVQLMRQPVRWRLKCR